MKKRKIAVIGIGATGSVLSAALLKNDPEIILIDPAPGLGDKIRENGIRV